MLLVSLTECIVNLDVTTKKPERNLPPRRSGPLDQHSTVNHDRLIERDRIHPQLAGVDSPMPGDDPLG